MHGFIVERLIPHSGELTTTDLRAIAEQGMLVQKALKGRIQWIHSAFTVDKMVCLYIADDEEAIREHAAYSGLPIEKISRVTAIISPQWLG